MQLERGTAAAARRPRTPRDHRQLYAQVFLEELDRLAGVAMIPPTRAGRQHRWLGRACRSARRSRSIGQIELGCVCPGHVDSAGRAAGDRTPTRPRYRPHKAAARSNRLKRRAVYQSTIGTNTLTYGCRVYVLDSSAGAGVVSPIDRRALYVAENRGLVGGAIAGRHGPRSRRDRTHTCELDLTDRTGDPAGHCGRAGPSHLLSGPAGSADHGQPASPASSSEEKPSHTVSLIRRRTRPACRGCCSSLQLHLSQACRAADFVRTHA